MGEAFGVDAEFLGGGAFPVVGAKHGADVVEVVGDAVARVDQGAVGAGAQAQAQRVGGDESLVQQRSQERIAGAGGVVVGAGAVDDAVDEHRLDCVAAARAPAHADLLSFRLKIQQSAGVNVKFPVTP